MDDISIIPLSQKYLEKAIKLVHTTFPEDAAMEINPGMAFRVSLEPEKHADFFAKDKADEMKYFIAIDTKKDKVVGTTGLYHLKKESKENIWLGWYCVDRNYRGIGIGKALLQYTIVEAKKDKRKYLYLYTEEMYVEAQKLYDAFGFETVEITEPYEKEAIHKCLNLMK